MGDVAKSGPEQAVLALLKVYDEFVRTEDQQGNVVVVGPYSLDAVHENIRLAEDFKLQMTLFADYPNSLPRVKEVSRIIDRKYEHLYSDGTFCLGIHGELLLAQLENPSLVAFLDGPVRSFLYSYLFHERYQRYPFGDRAHGMRGILEYYGEVFEESEPTAIVRLLSAVCSAKYRGHLPCPCGSGLIARKCHGSTILELKKNGAANAFAYDLETVRNEVVCRGCVTKLRSQMGRLISDGAAREYLA